MREDKISALYCVRSFIMPREGESDIEGRLGSGLTKDLVEYIGNKIDEVREEDL